MEHTIRALYTWDNPLKIGKGTGRQKIKDQVETIQTTALRSARILRSVMET